MHSKSRFYGIIFWSVISAAFIGPGTVTTAMKAGAGFGAGMLWFLVFSTVACITIQEAVSRLSILTNQSFGELLIKKFSSKAKAILYFTALSIALGCGAYEAGNMLGAIAGIHLLTQHFFSTEMLMILVGGIVGFLLWKGNVATLSHVLGVLVFLMGIAFISIALSVPISSLQFFQLPPSNSENTPLLLALGLVGTTIVPYNVFLGSGLSKGQKLKQMQRQLPISIAIGGVISVCILLSGTLISGEASFKTLANMVQNHTPFNGYWLIGIGLFAAGLSSAITAPMAAKLTFQSLFPNKTHHWIWVVIVLSAMLFGFFDLKPIPVIIAAQAFNAFFLPFILIMVLLTINDTALNPAGNAWYSNSILLLLSTFVLAMGLKAILSLLLGSLINQNALLLYLCFSSAVLVHIVLGLKIFRK